MFRQMRTRHSSYFQARHFVWFAHTVPRQPDVGKLDSCAVAPCSAVLTQMKLPFSYMTLHSYTDPPHGPSKLRSVRIS
jgi:hypothetical protein